jgi:hypothetical protein
MGRRLTSFWNYGARAWAGIGGLGMVTLFVWLDGPAAWLSNFVGVVACKALGLLPYLLPVVWRALQALAFDSQPAAPCPVQMLVCLWPLVQVVAGAA